MYTKYSQRSHTTSELDQVRLFWNAILKDKFTPKLEDIVDHVKLDKGVFWPIEMESVLFIRQCDKDIFAEIVSSKSSGFVIIGMHKIPFAPLNL
jgi:hypothetical protein